LEPSVQLSLINNNRRRLRCTTWHKLFGQILPEGNFKLFFITHVEIIESTGTQWSAYKKKSGQMDFEMERVILIWTKSVSYWTGLL